MIILPPILCPNLRNAPMKRTKGKKAITVPPALELRRLVWTLELKVNMHNLVHK
jgi:hypothetical protein